MRPTLGRCAGALVLVAIGIGFACEPIVGDPAPAAPINACPAHPCDAYKQSGDAPSCNDGVCTVSTPTSHLLLVIGLATDSFLAPGRTYVTTLNGGPPAAGDPCALPDCPASPTASGTRLCVLPAWAEDQSWYLVDPQASNTEAKWYLGNKTGSTTLPVQATYRRLLEAPPDAGADAAMQDGAPPLQDALDHGLPVDPILADVVTMTPGNFGPNGSPQIQFRTYMQVGCYERTLQPFAPLSTAFPPEIKPWPRPDEGTSLTDFDTTTEQTVPTGQTKSFPRFDISRTEGLDGWTVYLRNTQTKRVFSNVVPLRGSLAQGVTLLTNHSDKPAGQPPPFEALTGLELVLAPPLGQPQPTYVIAPIAHEFEPPVSYPSLPTPVTETVRIATPAGVAVSANVYFTATDITDRLGGVFPPNFEFSTAVATTTDPRTGASTYSALLPQGDYRIAVRPTDGKSAVTVVHRAVGGQGNRMTGEDIDVAPLVTVSGTATVADRRPLAEALVEVLPTACAATADATSGPNAPADCLPRTEQMATASDGRFSLAVDPGEYLLRVQPRQGSHLPWKVQRITVGADSLPLGKIVIPAPISVGMVLTETDVKTNLVVNAVVRVFTDPTWTGSAVELGQAITDVDGNFEMYIAPPPDPVAAPGF